MAMGKHVALVVSLCLIVSIFGTGCSTTKSTKSAEAKVPAKHKLPDEIRGGWVWYNTAFSTDKELDRLLDFCQKYDLNTLLVEIQGDTDSPTFKIKNPKELTRLVDKATQRGISIEALVGAKDMAVAANQPATLAVLDAIIDLNESMPKKARFAAVHFDIEPYVMPEWKKDQASREVIMRDLLDFYTKARQKLDDRGSEMNLACDIAMWYDRKTEPDNNCIIEYNGQTKNVHQHIQDICDYVGVMSFRTKVEGSNGIIDVADSEISYAASIGKKVCVSVEVSKLDELPQISFYGWEPEAFLEQYGLIRSTLKGRPGYGGVLVQSIRAMRNLLENEPLPEMK